MPSRAMPPAATRQCGAGALLPDRAAICCDRAMAHDEDLANRIRELIAAEPDVTEQRMFGGVAFLAAGKLAVAASGQGGLMVRVAHDETEALAARPHAGPMIMRGRPARGWVRVATEGVRTRRGLEPWVRRGMAHARSLA